MNQTTKARIFAILFWCSAIFSSSFGLSETPVIKIPTISIDQFRPGDTYSWNRTRVENGVVQDMGGFIYSVVMVDAGRVGFYIFERQRGEDDNIITSYFEANPGDCVRSYTDPTAPDFNLHWWDRTSNGWEERGPRYVTTAFEAYFNCNPDPYPHGKDNVEIWRQTLDHPRLGALELIKRVYNQFEPSYWGSWQILNPKHQSITAKRSYYLSGSVYNEELQ